MYIERLELRNIRTFVEAEVEFIHPDRAFSPQKPREASNARAGVPKPRLPNVNLLLGDNGSGKSSILRAVAMTTLGPAFEDTRLPTPGMVRRGGQTEVRGLPPDQGEVVASLLLHDQDRARFRHPTSEFRLTRRGELENAAFVRSGSAIAEGSGGKPRVILEKIWEPVYESNNDAFFAVGYGATRRVEAPENLDMATRGRTSFVRAQRVQSLFQESFSLIPLSTWLPRLRKENRGRYVQVEHLLNRLLAPARYTFTGEQERNGDYLFEHGGLKVPFQALSDGYRAFIGWVADMLFHVCFGCPSGKKLVENSGIVMVDEIDLHLHPRWQMKVIPTIARALPRVQFILTSHSPLVASSLEWMNIVTLKLGATTNQTRIRRLKQSIHGLDADQVLISDFFGLKTTRTPEKARRLDELTQKARGGDDEAARKVVEELALGLEDLA